jgi:hypothetical protein
VVEGQGGQTRRESGDNKSDDKPAKVRLGMRQRTSLLSQWNLTGLAAANLIVAIVGDLSGGF